MSTTPPALAVTRMLTHDLIAVANLLVFFSVDTSGLNNIFVK